MTPNPTERHGLGRAAAGLRAAGLVERLVALRLVAEDPGVTAGGVAAGSGSTVKFALGQLTALRGAGLVSAAGRDGAYLGYTLTGAGAAVLAAARALGEGTP